MKKIWQSSYPKQVPIEINPDQYTSLIDIFDDSFKKFADEPAFYNMGKTITYQELDHYSQNIAAYFSQTLQLKKGDRIALMLPNILQYPLVLLGAWRAGLIVVNVNPLYTANELAHQLKDSGAETIVVVENFAETVQQALSSVSLKHIIVTQLGDLLPCWKRILINLVLRWKNKLPTQKIPKTILLKNVLATGKTLRYRPATLQSSDLALLQYTGGTTGVSKGAMLTHRNLISNLLQIEAWVGSQFTQHKEIMITALPLYHIFSLMCNALLVMKIGGLNVLITNPRHVTDMVKEMAKFAFTAITGVNTLYNALLHEPRFAQLDFKTLQWSVGGGMALQREVAEKWQHVTDCPLLEGYGLTECSPCVSVNPMNLTTYNGTAGLPLPSTDVCILDDEQHELPLNMPGELAIKGPQVMKGYWNNPTETKKVFTKDGWLLTGDIASIDEQGFIHLLERKKDMILISGFNVYPNEIEGVLVQIPGVREAVVIGVPDKNSGEAVKAYIVRDNFQLTTEDILQACHQSLTGYKIPKYIEFVHELPKNNVGKILRRVLRD